MLDFLRRRARASARSPIIKTFLGIIIVVFVFWGVGSMTATRRLEVVAEVNDRLIGLREFQNAYENVRRNYRRQYPDTLSPELMQFLDLKGRTLDGMITTALLLQEARRLRLGVDDAELRETIAARPDFRDDGGFRKQVYVRTLRASGVTPAEFEEQQRQSILVDKVRGVVTDGVEASDAEARDLYAFNNEKVSLRFVKFSSADLFDRVTVDDAEVAKYYDDHRESFRQPDRVRLRYVAYEPSRYTSEVEVSNDEVEAYYAANTDAFRQPGGVRARHILFSVPAGAGNEERSRVRARAQTVLERARSGEDFAALAREHSQDKATAEQGGELGLVTKDRMLAPFEEAVFGLEAGKISDLVETPLGFHIIRADAVEEERTRPLEEVAGEIRERLGGEKASDLALARCEQDREKVAQGASLERAAQEAGLPVQEPPPVARDESIPDLGRQPELIAAAFDVPLNGISDPLKIGGAYYLVSPAERIPSAVAELAAVRDQAERRLKHERSEELAKEKARALLAALQAGEGLPSVARRAGLQVEETDPFSREGSYIPKMDALPELKKDAFALTPEKPVASQVYVGSGNAYLAVLKERVEPELKDFDNQSENLKRILTERKRESVMAEFVRTLKEGAEIRVNQSLLETIS